MGSKLADCLRKAPRIPRSMKTGLRTAARRRVKGGESEAAAAKAVVEEMLAATRGEVAALRSGMTTESEPQISADGRGFSAAGEGTTESGRNDSSSVDAAALSTDELVAQNMGLAVNIAKGFANIGGPMEDIVSAARTALVRAAGAYDPAVGPFAAFAGKAIRNELLNLYGREKRYRDNVSVTLDESGKEKGESGNEESAKDRVSREGAAEVTGPIERGETSAELAAAIAQLPERPRVILQRMAEGASGAEIGRELGVSRETVSTIAQNARAAVAGILKRRGLKGVDADGVLYARRDISTYEHVAQALKVNEAKEVDGSVYLKKEGGYGVPGGVYVSDDLPIDQLHPTEDAVRNPNAGKESTEIDIHSMPPLLVSGDYGDGFDVFDGNHRLKQLNEQGYSGDVPVWRMVANEDGIPWDMLDDNFRLSENFKTKPGGGVQLMARPSAVPIPLAGVGNSPLDWIDVNERKRWWRLPAIAFESGADVLERQKNPVALELSAALHKNTDARAAIEAAITMPLERVLTGRSKAESGKMKAEMSEYQRLKETVGANAPAAQTYLANMSAGGRDLLNAWRRVVTYTGNLAVKRGVQVWDEALGAYRPIGNKGGDYWPRVIKSAVRRVIEDPDKHAADRAKFEADLLADGWSQERVDDFFEGEAPSFLQRNDFFGQLEVARSTKLPDSFYEYDFNQVAGQFLGGYARRMAQIISFGQKLQRDVTSKDKFDEAIEQSRNEPTREFVQALQKQVYGIGERTGWARFTANARALASGLLLANPFTTVPRNVISGVMSTVEQVGTLRAMKALGQIVSGSVSQMTARQLGTVKASFLDALEYSDPDMDISDWVRKFTGTTLKFSGYNASEEFVRTLATASAMQYVTDFLGAAPNSKMAQEAEAMMGRLKVDVAAVRAEKGDFGHGRETRTLVRRLVKEAQFGYDASQVPVWANGPTGRLFYQFGRWGTQRTRSLWRHTFEPALFGELRDVAGKKVKVRNLKPLATALTTSMVRGIQIGAGAVLTGEMFAMMAQMLFKRDRDDDDWEIIFKKLEAGEEQALGKLMTRLSNDIMMGGMLGILSQPADLLKSWVQGARFKNPLEPPASAVPKAAFEVAKSWTERGLPGDVDDATAGHGKDLWMALRGVLPGTGAAADVAGRMGALVSDQVSWFEGADAKRTVNNLRKATRRFAEEVGMEGGGMFDGRFTKKPQTASYDRLQDALLTGDVEDGQVVVASYLERFGAEDPGRAMKSLKAMVSARQPIKVGGHRGEELKREFLDWAAQNLSSERFAEVMALQQRYEDTARGLGLMEEK